VAIISGVLSVLAIAGVLLGTGSFSEDIDRDLDFSGASPDWLGRRSFNDFEIFVDDPDLRSEWEHEDGWLVSVFAYPLGGTASIDQFRQEFRRQERANGFTILLEDDAIPAPFEGFRLIEQVPGRDQIPLALVYYFVYDPKGKDIHQMLAVTGPEFATDAETLMWSLMERATWIDAVEPEKAEPFI
jgi:hypothetical protein